jgi:Domain of unknown function (DUF1707)
MTSAASPGGFGSEPPAGDQTRASDAEREQVADALRDAMAEGRLDMAEFEERLDAALQARTRAELVPLLRDLPAPGSVVAPSASAVDPAWADRVGVTASSGPVSGGGVGILGQFQRKGRWTVARRFTAFSLLGGGEIDLREARFEDREVVIRCFAILGGVQIIADPDVDVHVSGIGILGGFDQDGAGESAPGAPRVVVNGLALLGGVHVERKLRKEDRKRLEAEGRELPQDRSDRPRDYRDFREEQRELRRERHERHRELQRDRRDYRRERRDSRHGGRPNYRKDSDD